MCFSLYSCSNVPDAFDALRNFSNKVNDPSHRTVLVTGLSSNTTVEKVINTRYAFNYCYMNNPLYACS